MLLPFLLESCLPEWWQQSHYIEDCGNEYY